MKKILLLLVLFYQTYTCIAQQYIPFPTTSNAVWRENASNFSGLTSHQFSFYEITIVKDTVINTFTYHELGVTGWGYDMLYFNGGWNGPYAGGVPLPCCGAIREGGQKKIYFFDYYNSTEYLLYDFNLSVGDTLPTTYINSQINPNVVNGIDSVEINGQYHKRFLIATSWDPATPYGAYIEGVGYTNGLLGGELHETVPPFEVYSKTICFKENGSSTMIDTLIDPSACDLYSSTGPEKNFADNNVVITPNPTSGKIKINMPASSLNKIEVYNLCGEKEMEFNFSDVDISSLPQGIYLLQVYTNEKILRTKVIKQ